MAQLEARFFDITAFDTLAAQDTPIHRIDPRIKIVTTFMLILAIVSFDKHEPVRLIPFLLYPVVLISWGRLSAGFIVKKTLLVLPFALLMACYNLAAHRTILFYVNGLGITGGMLSSTSILLRFCIAIVSSFGLIGTTGFIRLCSSLHRLPVPGILVVQLLLLYRYLFVLIEEALRIVQAHKMRAFGQKISLKVFLSLAGSLLIRSIDRAQRIYQAMLARGFDGTVRAGRKREHCTLGDFAFFLFWLLFFFMRPVYQYSRTAGDRLEHTFIPGYLITG